jgi:hypothetical protein
MPKTAFRFVALAALCAAPVIGFAQMRSAPSPATAVRGPVNPQSPPTAPSPPAATGAAANTNATAPTTPLSTGLTVKDNTGLAIGQISDVKTDASGKSMATIKMGANSFQVPAANLAVANGAATINLTKAQIDAQLPKK